MESVKKKEKYFEVFSKIFLFQNVQQAVVRAAFTDVLCECACFDTLEVVYSRSSYKKSMGIVLSGEVKAVKHDGDGTEIVMSSFPAGGVFGVAALFNDSTSYVTEITAVRKTKVLFLSQPLLRKLFALDLTIAENYIAYLSGRICYLNKRIDSFTAGTAEQKLVGYLMELTGDADAPQLELTLPCSLTELSARLNIGRASLYRAMDGLIASGAIFRNGKCITVLDLEKLKVFPDL